jgi:hypothetical protein
MLKWFAFDSKFKPGIYDKTFKECAERGMTALCANCRGWRTLFSFQGEMWDGKPRFLQILTVNGLF